VLRLFGELSKRDTYENFHYLASGSRATICKGSMVRFDPEGSPETAWAEPDRFEVKAKRLR